MAVEVLHEDGKNQEHVMKLSWSSHHKGDNLKINNDTNELKKISGYHWESCFSLQTFSFNEYKQHKLRFEIKIVNSSYNEIIIGIINNCQHENGG